MNKNLMKILGLCLMSSIIKAQTSVEEITITMDSLKLPNTINYSLKNYRQFGNVLIGETEQEFSYRYNTPAVTWNGYTPAPGYYKTTVKVKYISDDFGKTWREAIDTNVIKEQNMSLISDKSKLYYYSTGKPENETNFDINKYRYKRVNKVKVYGNDSLQTNDTSEVIFSAGQYIATLEDFEPIIYDFDSVSFKRSFKTWNERPNSLSGTTEFKYYYTIDGGKLWKPFILKNFTDIVSPYPYYQTPFELDYKGNGFFAFKDNKKLIHIYKYPNFDSAYATFDSISLTNKYSFLSYKGVDYLYTSNKDSLFVKVLNSNLPKSTIPFDIRFKRNDESSIFLDKDNKTIYLVTHKGIFKSEDPFFQTYTKIHNSRISSLTNPLAFSVLTSGICINDENGNLTYSDTKGDTWAKIADGFFYKQGINFVRFILFDTTLVFTDENNKAFQTSDFKTISDNRFFNFNTINFLNYDGKGQRFETFYPYYGGTISNNNYRIGQYESSDMGQTWLIKPQPIDSMADFYSQKFKNYSLSQNAVKYIFTDTNNITVITTANEIFLSTDKGNNWEIVFLASFIEQALKFNKYLIFKGRYKNTDTNNGVYISENYGKTFKKISKAERDFGPPNTKIFLTGDKYLYSTNVGDLGSIPFGFSNRTNPARIHLDSLSKYFAPKIHLYDVNIFITNVSQARPNSEFDFKVKVKNLGTQMIEDATASFKIPSQYVTYISADGNALYQNGQITWNIKNLMQNDEKQYTVSLKLLDSAVINTHLNFKGNINLLNKIDENSFDNQDSTTIVVDKNYYPNNKSVFPLGKILQNTYSLDYTIHFQNTTLDTVRNVSIIDTLSTSLNGNTVKVLASSHPCQTIIKDNIIQFIMNNINLPDSNHNEKASHGFVRFRIERFTGLSKGTIINNNASIIYDLNKPITTPITFTEIYRPKIILSEVNNTLCQGGTFNNVVYNTSKRDTVLKYQDVTTDYVNITNIDVKPKYYLIIDTLITTLTYNNKIVKDGDTIINKNLKTYKWNCDSIVRYVARKISSNGHISDDFLSFQVYPNPTSDYLSIKYQLQKATCVEFSIYNTLGQKVKTLQEKTQNTEGGYQITKSVNDLQAGVYQLGIRTEKGIFYRRFIKM